VKVPFQISADNVTRIPETDVHKSLREVLANALIHADYHGRRGIVIDKYPKRLEVSNPGTLRIGKSVAIAGGTSDARNGKIFNIFSLVDIGERSGMGISSLYGVWERQKYADPAIAQEYEPDRTKVVVKFESEASEVTEKVTENGSKVAEKVTENRFEDTEKVTENARRVSAVNNTERAIMRLILEDSAVTQGFLSEKLGLSRPYVARTMLELQTRGLIRRVGPDKGGHWEVIIMDKGDVESCL